MCKKYNKDFNIKTFRSPLITSTLWNTLFSSSVNNGPTERRKENDCIQ